MRVGRGTGPVHQTFACQIFPHWPTLALFQRTWQSDQRKNMTTCYVRSCASQSCFYTNTINTAHVQPEFNYKNT
jgi:hypothetical protein